MIFVAKVNIDRLDAYGPGGDQSALQKPVRIAFQIVTILEKLLARLRRC